MQATARPCWPTGQNSINGSARIDAALPNWRPFMTAQHKLKSAASRLAFLYWMMPSLLMPALAQAADETQAGPGGASPALVQDLVAASRILADQGVVDGFGHVSARHDKNPKHFLMSRSMAPALVTAADIMEFDEECQPVAANGRSAFLERFIHCEIYRQRPDVNAVVHNHAPALIPFGISKQQLRPVFHMSGFLGGEVPVFEIREHGGDSTDMLIRNRELAGSLARVMGARPVVLMRGHGATVVGQSLPQAVFRAVYTQINAKLQLDALQLGGVTYLNATEAEKAAATNDGQLKRAWDLWKLKAAAP
jgi:HCOMODA/2-hydroxy-3-carboxy-muconic semialdehyde decarboxylase